jgi:hypothetical protein
MQVRLANLRQLLDPGVRFVQESWQELQRVWLRIQRSRCCKRLSWFSIGRNSDGVGRTVRIRSA